MKTSPKCLIVTGIADRFAREIARLSDESIPATACAAATEALARYTDETILFGTPDLIADVLPAMPTVDWVQSSWAGVTPLIELERRDYVLTGVKGVFGPQMAEYVLGYLLERELRIAERREHQAERRWFTEFSGTLHNRRLGIMGTGSIGRHIAGMARHFGMRTVGLSRSGSPAEGFDEVLPVDSLHRFLGSLDYLVSTLPQTAETDGLLDARALAQLPRHACFINVGRGNVVDHGALIAALQDERLGGAVLDVFETEPLPQESPLWSTPGLSVTAHVAAVSHPLLIVPVFVENYRRYCRGQELDYVVDFEAGY